MCRHPVWRVERGRIDIESPTRLVWNSTPDWVKPRALSHARRDRRGAQENRTTPGGACPFPDADRPAAIAVEQQPTVWRPDGRSRWPDARGSHTPSTSDRRHGCLVPARLRPAAHRGRRADHGRAGDTLGRVRKLQHTIERAGLRGQQGECVGAIVDPQPCLNQLVDGEHRCRASMVTSDGTAAKSRSAPSARSDHVHAGR